MKRYIQFYNKDGLEMCGSDSIVVFDQRLSNDRALLEAKSRIEKQFTAWSISPNRFIKPKNKYARVMQNLRTPVVITKTIMLHDLF